VYSEKGGFHLDFGALHNLLLAGEGPVKVFQFFHAEDVILC